MPSLPDVAVATAAAATEGDVKNFLTYQHWFLSDLFGSSGTKPATRTALQVPMHSKTDKSGAYTVLAADQGKVINCTGTWTLAITEAATLGDGFVVAVMNSGAGTITIDPAGVETIDGAATKTLGAGKLLLIYCNGASFASVGSVDSASIVAALGYTPSEVGHTHSYVSTNMTHGAVGSLCFARKGVTTTISPGGTAAGSSLSATAIVTSSDSGVSGAYSYSSSTLSGTWRCLGFIPDTNNSAQVGHTLWQRIS